MNYKAWNAKLTGHFFNADGADRLAYLRVDPDELAVILGSDDPDAARADFTKAIQEAVRGDGTLKRLEELPDFPLWFLLKKLKKDEDQLPPFVGLLAASVLAGFDMANDPRAGLSAGAYYPRLAKILAVPDIPNDGRYRLRRWWQLLNKWLDEDLEGSKGRSTARPSGQYTIIGYPLSQCTLRREDRSRLPDFFRWCRLQPGEAVEEDELGGDFDSWVHMNRCSLTSRTTLVLRKLFDAGEADAAVADIVAEYERWDGTSRDRQGSRWGVIDLQAAVVREHRRLELRFVAKQPPGFPDGDFTLMEASARKQLALRTADPGYYEPLEIEADDSRLRLGFELIGSGCGLRFPLRKVYLLEQDFSFGEWITRDQASIGEPCILIAATEEGATVEHLLEIGAKRGWHRIVAGGERTGLPSRWRGYCCVEFERAVSAPYGLESLEARAHVDIQFIGGLNFGAGSWMQGALPELAVSTEMEAEVEIEVGSLMKSKVEPPFRFNLNRLDFPTGEHRIRIGHRTRWIRVEKGAPPDVRQPGQEIGWAFRPGDDPISAPFATADAPRSGPYLTGAVSSPEAALRIKRRRVALYPGHARVAWLGPEPGQISWLRERALVEDVEENALNLTSPSDFTAAWLWCEVEGQSTLLPENHPPPPVASAVGPGNRKWRKVSSSLKDLSDALAAYGSSGPDMAQPSSEQDLAWADMILKATLNEGCSAHEECTSRFAYYKQKAREYIK